MGGRVTENNKQGESTKMPPMTRFCGERVAMLIHLKNILLGGDRVVRELSRFLEWLGSGESGGHMDDHLPAHNAWSHVVILDCLFFCALLSSVGKCVSATGPKDTFDGWAQGKSSCEDDISKGLVDGRVEGQTGVQVESEVVLNCEGNNDEGA